MKVLNLYSNWKWTGPAEHALATAQYFFKKGYDLTFACAHPPVEVEDSLIQRARKTGVPLVNGFYLNKHMHVWQNAHDIGRLVKIINKMNFDLIHTHLVNDHLIAGIAARLSSKKRALVRTVYDGTGLSRGFRNRGLLAFSTDALITVSEISRHAIQKQFAFPKNKLWLIPPGVDCERFNTNIDSNRVR
jgi:glycosyltransferase involved in cell wall biosynthesis